MFDRETIGKMKKGAYLINTARGAIADCEAVKEACESGQLGGGDSFPLSFPWSPEQVQPANPYLLDTHVRVSMLPHRSVQIL